MRAASPAEMKLVLTVIDAEEGGAEGSVGVKLVVENEEARARVRSRGGHGGGALPRPRR